MKGIAHFYKLNYDFSPEFAKAHHHGEESENNRKFDWEDELEITSDISDIQVEEDGIFTLQGEKDTRPFSVDISKMTCFNFIGIDATKTVFACSTSLIHHFDIQHTENKKVLSVYLKEEEPLTNPTHGVYIALFDFPEFLIE